MRGTGVLHYSTERRNESGPWWKDGTVHGRISWRIPIAGEAGLVTVERLIPGGPVVADRREREGGRGFRGLTDDLLDDLVTSKRHPLIVFVRPNECVPTERPSASGVRGRRRRRRRRGFNSKPSLAAG